MWAHRRRISGAVICFSRPAIRFATVLKALQELDRSWALTFCQSAAMLD